MKKLTKPVTIKTMLADSTVSDQKTFDPQLVQYFYKKIIDNLPEWDSDGVSTSNNEDVRRLFVKFHTKVQNYILSFHMSLQFHVLLFYKPAKEVIEYQKELSNIINKLKNEDGSISENRDKAILKKLEKKGYKNLDAQKLFEVLFEDDEMRNTIYKELDDTLDRDYTKLTKRQQTIIEELNSLLIETYQTTPVLIDDRRLVTGEEGYLCTLDLEFVKNKMRSGTFDPKKIPESIKTTIAERLDKILQIIND